MLLSEEQTRRPRLRRRVRRALRALSTILIVSGALLILDAGITLVWQEPISAVYAKVQ
jgi:sortase A